MIRYQRSSPTNIFTAVKQLAKKIELFAYKMTLMYEKVRTLRKANKAFAKRRRTKKSYIRAEGVLSIQNALDLIE